MRTNLKVTDQKERHCVARAIWTFKQKSYLMDGKERHIVFIYYVNGFMQYAIADREQKRVIQVCIKDVIIDL